MICTRCQGLMTQEELRDWGGGKGSDLSWAFRCIPCGNIIDPVILHNRITGGRRALLGAKRERFEARMIPIQPRKSCAVEC